MPKIFFCYRRQDSNYQAGRLFDHLSRHFGSRNLFKDVDSMPLGQDFRRVLDEKVAECDVLLALVGDEWLTCTSPSGQRRLDDPTDFVRIEIESALQRGVHVIPLLVGQAPLPPPESLPPSMRELAYRHGIPIRPDPDFQRDVDRLVRGISELSTETAPEQSRSARITIPVGFGAATSFIIALIAGALGLSGLAGVSSTIARFLALGFIILGVISLIVGRTPRRRSS
jgi:uncharacterized membrane protein YtjA (UPF0391 family)